MHLSYGSSEIKSKWPLVGSIGNWVDGSLPDDRRNPGYRRFKKVHLITVGRAITGPVSGAKKISDQRIIIIRPKGRHVCLWKNVPGNHVAPKRTHRFGVSRLPRLQEV